MSNTHKQIQAAAVLAKLEGGRIDRIRLLKLLYIADREALAESGAPILGGRVVAMNNGPLHSAVYDLIKLCPNPWSEHFANDGHVVVLKSDPGRLDLSDDEISRLTSVSDARRSVDSWAVAEETHQFAEWLETHVQDTSVTIPLERILSALGFEGAEIREIKKDEEGYQRMLRILG